MFDIHLEMVVNTHPWDSDIKIFYCSRQNNFTVCLYCIHIIISNILQHIPLCTGNCRNWHDLHFCQRLCEFWRMVLLRGLLVHRLLRYLHCCGDMCAQYILSPASCKYSSQNVVALLLLRCSSTIIRTPLVFFFFFFYTNVSR